MDIYQLEVFSSVYRLRSFSKASGELNITQPSVSMHIKRLEEDLGVKLFDRSGRSTVPTRDADILYARAEELIQKLRGLREELGGAGPEIEGILAIGTSSTTAAYMLPYIAAEFRKLHPKVFFQLAVKSSAEIYSRLEKGELPAAIVDDLKEREWLSLEHSIVDEMVLVTAPGYLNKKTITPLGILRVPLIMRDEDSDARKSMEKQHLLHKISLRGLNVVAIVGSADALREAVKAGLGASILSRFAVKDDLKAGLLEEVRIRGVRMRRTLYVITHRHRLLPRPHEAFISYLKENLITS